MFCTFFFLWNHCWVVVQRCSCLWYLDRKIIQGLFLMECHTKIHCLLECQLPRQEKQAFTLVVIFVKCFSSTPLPPTEFMTVELSCLEITVWTKAQENSSWFHFFVWFPKKKKCLISILEGCWHLDLHTFFNGKKWLESNVSLFIYMFIL